MKNKIFRTLDEQISILRSKNLVINDEEKTKQILLKENYFFISGYRHLLMKNYKDKNFIKGSTFEELYAIFNFDRHIRNICFKNILIIENNIKSKMRVYTSDDPNAAWDLKKDLSTGVICGYNIKHYDLLNAIRKKRSIILRFLFFVRKTGIYAFCN